MATADVMKDDPGFDAAFYVAAYPDLAELTHEAARDHYRRLGRAEGRHGDLASGLAALQARLGPLPAGFDPAAYHALHADAPGDPLRAAEHYLAIGRAHARDYAAVHLQRRRARQLGRLDAAVAAPRVHRSGVEARRLRLQRLFGAPQVDDALVRGVGAALDAAFRAPSPAAPALGEAVVGRWLLGGGGAGDFAQLSTQLQAIHAALFADPAAPRSAAEMVEVNRAARRAVDAEVAAGEPAPLTLFMLAVRAVACGADPAADLAAPAAAVAAFFGRDVVDLGLQRFVTREQRAALRAAGPGDGPWAQSLRAAHRPARDRAPASAAVDAAAPFWSEGVWTGAMDYVLSGPQLAASRIAVEADAAGAPRLRAPGFLVSEAEVLDRQAAHAWLRRWVEAGAAEIEGWPLLVDSSAAAYARGWPPLPPGAPADGDDSDDSLTDQPGADALRPGDLVTFGVGSLGARLAVGPGWAPPVGGAARLEGEAGLAFSVDAPQGASLDLFLDVAAASREVGRLGVVWNGRLAADLPLAAAAQGWLPMHLGAPRRGEANALRLIALPRDPHAPGPRRLALRRLALAAR